VGGAGVDAELSREEFEGMTSELFDETINATDELFERSEFSVGDVDKVLLIGGATRMPQVRNGVEEYFGMEPSVEMNPDRAVAQGAAIQAELLSDEATGVTDEIVGVDDGVVLVDVAPRSLGIELHDDTTSHIIESDDEIPTMVRREDFRTVEDDQTTVKFPVVEGESDDATENEKIGMVTLEDIPPRPSTDESLAVEFELTSDGTLQVEAEDLETGEAVSSSFESSITRDDEEISKLQADLPTL
jgi:molecular chaperone DnaK